MSYTSLCCTASYDNQHCNVLLYTKLCHAMRCCSVPELNLYDVTMALDDNFQRQTRQVHRERDREEIEIVGFKYSSLLQ
jgi:hypothetical protein